MTELNLFCRIIKVLVLDLKCQILMDRMIVPEIRYLILVDDHNRNHTLMQLNKCFSRYSGGHKYLLLIRNHSVSHKKYC